MERGREEETRFARQLVSLVAEFRECIEYPSMIGWERTNFTMEQKGVQALHTEI